MITLERLNVVKIVDNEEKAVRLEKEGFVRVEDAPQEVENELPKKPGGKAADSPSQKMGGGSA